MSYNLRTKTKTGSPKVAQFHNYATSSSSSQAEKSSFTPVTNINDLKKITPRVKVLNQETPTLQSLRKSSLESPNFPSPKKLSSQESSNSFQSSSRKSSQESQSSRKSTNLSLTRKETKSNQKTIILSSPEKNDDDTEIIDEETKNKMRKYCRTCAEQKFPLVDIFSDKGIQMRLNLQIKHLQQIAESDSLTTQMCMDCICDLKMSFTFFVQIKKAEMKLRAIRAKFVEDYQENFLPSIDKFSFGSEKGGKETKGNEKETKGNEKCFDSETKIQSLIQHDATNLKNNGPRISAVFSTNATEWERKKGDRVVNSPGVTKIGSMISSSGSLLPKDGKIEREVKDEEKVKIEPKGNQDESDNESIEEFDPEDPGFNPTDEEDEEEVEESSVLNPFKRTIEKIETGASNKNSPRESCLKQNSLKLSSNQISSKETYSKDFANVSKESSSKDFSNVSKDSSLKDLSILSKESYSKDFSNLAKESCSKDFSSLSKDFSNLSKREEVEETTSRGEEEKKLLESEEQGLKRKFSETRSKGFDPKIRKFNVNDALSIKQEENGVMYVTVRGEKPNELLLVKVKKMEKAEKSRPGRKESDNLFVDRSLEQKGQIIEHQIEQYKRRREKVLGPIATTEIIIPECRIKTEQESLPNQFLNQFLNQSDQSSNQFSNQSSNQTNKSLNLSSNLSLNISSNQSSNLSLISSNQSSNLSLNLPSNISSTLSSNISSNQLSTLSSPQTLSDNFPLNNPTLKLKDISEIKKEKPQRCKDRKMPVDVKVYTNAEDYNNRIETVKSKLEDKQRKDWEEVNPEQESTLERLRRILEGKDDESLGEFMENLQQRKMIIMKMSDEDLVNLYQERMAGKIYTNTNEESDPLELNLDCFDLKSSESFDCDFCFSEFPTKDVCDEHMKFHDSKIQYLCEDCNEEFTILRYKKNHNVICIRKLICKYCDLMLDSKGKKKQHEQKHCDSLFGQLCEYCGEKFKHQGTLDQHVKSKHMTLEKIFQCPKCPKKFTFKTKLSFHLKSVHTAMRAYLCEDCGADFKNPASLRHHRIRKHLPTGNKRECPVCRKMIPFYSLSKHMHTHKAYTIKCPHCDKMFKNSSTLKQHVRIHEDQRQFRCDTCGVGFNRRDGLRLHMKVHEKADSRGLKECSCQVCGEKFPNHSMLVIHRNRIHKDGRNFTCHICNRSMISTRSLEWHLAHIHNEPLPGIVKAEMITGSDSKRVACFHCHKTFKTEMILRTHIKNSHMEKEPVKCLDCDDTFVSEVRLRHHMMVAHNRLEGTLACPHCPKRFVNQLRLKTHMIAHSEERPFRCDICGFNLKTKIQLIKHHQNRHSDERPLQCRYCPWRCKQVSALVCHERTHTNERPYSCSVCRQRFKYLGDKNKHERRHESLGGSGFKRIVTNRGPKKVKTRKEDDDTSNSDQEQEMLEEQMEEQMEEPMDEQMEDDEMETMEMEARLVDAAYEAEEHVKIEANIIGTEDEHGDYPQDYEESSKDATEVIMNMEDTAVYTEEVTAENIESIETTQIIDDELMANQLLQSGTVVHIEQQDEEGKIQMIPVVLSLPDLTEENAEVNLATTSIMYNNEVEEEEEEEE